MKSLKLLLLVLCPLILAACSDDIPEIPGNAPGDAYVRGDKVVVNVGLTVPEMPVQQTRSMADAPDYADLHLYLLEFEDNGHPLRNTLTAVYEAEGETPQPDRVLYRITLNATSRPRILHLVAVPKGYNLEVPYGIESSVMSALVVENGTDAYWNRLLFPKGYATELADGSVVPTPEVTSELSHVPLIRNYAQVSMTCSDTDFTLQGFSIVNSPTKGTVAPYNAIAAEFPAFLGSDDKPLSYATVNGSYPGILPAGTNFDNQEISPVVGNDLNPKFIYERPVNSLNHTYLLIKGLYKGAVNYYKIDLGKTDADGVFRQMSFLRNFHYAINITNVGSEGYKTIAEAAAGVVFNNLSFDVNTRNLLNISDGNEVVFVEFTSAVITDDSESTLKFRYRYRDLNASGVKYTNNGVNLIGLEPGSVIKSVSVDTRDDSNGWRNVTIVCRPATAETQIQEFTVVKPSGLGRTIRLILHQKWDFVNVREFSGTYQNWPANASSVEGIAGAGMQDLLTVFFDIPDNLQESLFPLVFTLESNRQNIENNPIGSLVVDYGPSYWPGVQGQRIKYLKTITWTQYNQLLDESNQGVNGVAIPKEDGTFTRRVRCRFRTITSLANLGVAVGGQTETEVVITNENFNPATVKFIRRRTN